MILLAALVVAICVRASAHSESQAPPAAPVPVAPLAVTETHAEVDPGMHQAVGTLMTTGSLADVVDMVPGKKPSAVHPAGTMLIGTIVDAGEDRRQATIYEWDVARAATVDVRPIGLDDSNGKSNPGTPTAIRLATAGDRVIGVVEATGGAHALSAEGWGHRSGARASIAGGEGLVAVAYYADASSALDVELVHPSFYGAHVLGHTRVDGDKVAAGQRPAALAFLHGRLYVATRPNASETVVSELHIPSLRVLASYRHRRVSTRHQRSQLVVQGERLLLLDRGELVEIEPYMLPGASGAPTLELDADEVAAEEGRTFLTTGGLRAPSQRGEFVAALGAPASCTPSWSLRGDSASGVEPYPMLACAVAGGGVQVVRLPRPAKPASR